MEKEEYLRLIRKRECVLCAMESEKDENKNNNNNHIVQRAIIKDRIGEEVEEKGVLKSEYVGKNVKEVFSDEILCPTHNIEPLKRLENSKFKDTLYSKTVLEVGDEFLVSDLIYKKGLKYLPENPLEKAENDMYFDFIGSSEMENYFKIFFYNVVMFYYKKMLEYKGREDEKIIIFERFLYENRESYFNNTEWILQGKTEREEMNGGIVTTYGHDKNGEQIRAQATTLKLYKDREKRDEFTLKYKNTINKKTSGETVGFIIEFDVPFNDEVMLKGDVVYIIRGEEELTYGEADFIYPKKEVKYSVRIVGRLNKKKIN